MTRQEVRAALQNQSTALTLTELMERFEVRSQAEKIKLRDNLKKMIARGEVERVADKTYRYKADAVQPTPHAQKIKAWRVINIKKNTWNVHYIAAVSDVSKATVWRYCKDLERAGYIEQCGRDGFKTVFRTTAKGRTCNETPLPSSVEDELRELTAKVSRLAQALASMQGLSAEVIASLDLVQDELRQHNADLSEHLERTENNYVV